MGLRAQAELDLAETLEDPSDFGLPVILTGPDGTVYPSVYGRVVYDTVVQDENGIGVIDNNPLVTLRRSSLVRVPLADEKWAIEIPTGPEALAPTAKFMLESAPQDGKSLGYIHLHLRRAEQTP